VSAESGRYRRTMARCASSHEWPAVELFDDEGKMRPEDHHMDRVVPAHCPACTRTYVALID